MTAVKKRNVSKKRKIAWRKHIDIKDVDAFLEDQRLEQRLGKPFAERADDELFTIDTNNAPDDPLIHKGKKIEIRYEPKCFQMLKSHSQVSDPISKRNRVKLPDERAHPLAVKKRNLKRLKREEFKKQSEDDKRKKSKIIEDELTDIWNKQDVETVEKIVWLNKDTVRHNLAQTGKLKKTIPKSIHMKNSILPPVDTPHPGMSYNPSLNDHLKLLNEIMKKEQKMIKEEKHLTRVTSKMFSKVTLQNRNETIMAEMSEGLPLFDKAEKSDNEDSDNEYQAVNAPVINKKKDRKQRRKQAEQRKLEKERKAKKIEKRKISDIYKLRFIQSKFEKEKQKQEKAREKRLLKEKLKKLEPKRLAATKFENPEIEFNSAQDIAGNLRNIKTEGSLLSDRYKSLQKRNILAPAKIRMKKKTRVKKFVKRDHKIDDNK